MKQLARRAIGITPNDITASDDECFLYNVRSMDSGQPPLTNWTTGVFEHLFVPKGFPSGVAVDPASDERQFSEYDICFAAYTTQSTVRI
jgi:hypothetical protein